MGDNRKAIEDGIVALMDQPAPGPNGGKPEAPRRVVEIRMQMDMDSGAFEAHVTPPALVHNRSIMYAMLEMMRDVVYRQQLPGELAILNKAAGPAIVVAPDGAVPPFPRRL